MSASAATMAAPSRSIECPSEESVARFLEGDLGGAEREKLERHLSTCSDCLRIVGNAGRASSVALASTVFAGLEAPCPPVEAGTHVGRYVVRRSVGAGAMGRVYAAYDPTLDRQVALKILRGSANSPHLEARLLREAKVMARLAHRPEVVPVYDAGKHGAQLFIAMEFVEGGTLRAWLAARPRAWREIVAVFRDAGRGLAHAHAAGLVHRDFKPDNVLVSRDGRARVTDFGLARLTRDVSVSSPSSSRLVEREGLTVEASLTRTGALVGTPAYMAPEQLDGADADARSDIFSFCVAFYEALHGERPFQGSTVADLRRSASAGRIAPPVAHRSVPRSLSRVLKVGLRPAPDDRYDSMTALLDAIDRATRQPALRQVGLAGSLLAAAGAVLAVPFFRSARGADPTALPASLATTRVTAAAVGNGAAIPLAASTPSAVPVAPIAPEGSAAPVAPHPAGHSRPAPRPVLVLEDAAARKAPRGDEERVVEGRNGAPIMR